MANRKDTFEDLEVIVPTYNRAEYLKETLISIFNQTCIPGKITVLDNASTDYTEKIISEYDDITYIKNESNIGGVGNFEKAQSVAEKKWIMLFHDDDLMHPEYVNHIKQIIIANTDIGLIGTSYEYDYNPINFKWDQRKLEYSKHRIKEFAATIYKGFKLNTGAVVFRKDSFKQIKCDFENFGKISDRPFIFKAAENGLVALLKSSYVKYRVHLGQDCNTKDTGPFIDQLLMLNKLYLKYCGTSIFDFSGRVFLNNNLWILYRYYLWAGDNTKMSFLKYLKLALKKKSTTLFALLCGFICELVFFRIVYAEIKKRIKTFLNR